MKALILTIASQAMRRAATVMMMGTALAVIGCSTAAARAKTLEHHVLKFPNHFTSALNRYGALTSLTAKGKVLLQKGLLEGVTVDPAARSGHVGYFQNWTCLHQHLPAIVAFKDSKGFIVTGTLRQPHAATKTSVAFIERYTKTSAVAMSVKVQLNCPKAATWSEPMRFSFYFPAALFLGGQCDAESVHKIITTYPITQKKLASTSYGATKIWLHGREHTIEITADKTSQLMIIDGRGWGQPVLIVRLDVRQPWQTKNKTAAGYHATFGATISFKAKMP